MTDEITTYRDACHCSVPVFGRTSSTDPKKVTCNRCLERGKKRAAKK